MSRTYRRKGYEKTQATSWDRQGDKVARFYTVREYICWRRYEYREPTEQEYGRKYWEIHGDNHRNQYTPAREYRQFRIRQNRRINDRELHKFMTREEYEPMTQEEPISHWWDWR